MPMQSYMTIEGANQGAIDGGCTISGHEKEMEVYDLDHSVHIPRDPQTGLPSGSRVHGPMKVTKPEDVASPKLKQALASGEQLKTVEIKHFRITPTGTEEHYYTIKLETAIIVKIESGFACTKDAEMEQTGDVDTISMTYEKITWTYEDGGVEYTDNWKEPNA